MTKNTEKRLNRIHSYIGKVDKLLIQITEELDVLEFVNLAESEEQ